MQLLQGINDLQTEADRSAQRCIVNSLLKQFPKVTVIGEEVCNEDFSIHDLICIKKKIIRYFSIILLTTFHIIKKLSPKYGI